MSNFHVNSKIKKKNHQICRCPRFQGIQVKCPIFYAKSGKIEKEGHHVQKKMKTKLIKKMNRHKK